MANIEDIDDSHYLNPPVEREWCETHDLYRPCPECKAEMQEQQGEAERETRGLR